MTIVGKKEQEQGKAGEVRAEAALRRAGVFNVEKIGTPIRITGTKLIHGRHWYSIVWGDKVAADRRGELENGISVIAEVKTIFERNLRWSDLRKHQPGKLTSHKGISVIVWNNKRGANILRWPIPGFSKKGDSLTADQAEKLKVDRISS